MKAIDSRTSKRAAGGLAVALLLAGCAAAPPSPPIVGGWSRAAVDEDARAAAVFATQQTGHREAGLARIDALERQVVAGMNYRMRITLTDKSRWDAVVWRRLDGTISLTSLMPLP